MSLPVLQQYMAEPWFDQLKSACDERGVVAVAAELGFANHSGTSRVLNGSYGDTRRFAKRVQERLGGVHCPHTGQREPRSLCLTQMASQPPTHNPYKLAHWHACRRCPHQPKQD